MLGKKVSKPFKNGNEIGKGKVGIANLSKNF